MVAKIRRNYIIHKFSEGYFCYFVISCPIICKVRIIVLFLQRIYIGMQDIRSELLRKLKEENCFWSYDLSKMDDISDEALIEHVMLYLDIEDINKLFVIYKYKKVKRVWLDRVAPQGEMYRPYNILYAWYYFGAKRPEAYVKSIETRYLNRQLSA